MKNDFVFLSTKGFSLFKKILKYLRYAYNKLKLEKIEN